MVDYIYFILPVLALARKIFLLYGRWSKFELWDEFQTV